jgi:hypothetical protein
MNRNKSLGLTKNRGQNRPSNRNMKDPFDIMRMDDFNEFDSMFNNFGGGFDIFRNFGAISRRFDDMHSDMFSK